MIPNNGVQGTYYTDSRGNHIAISKRRIDPDQEQGKPETAHDADTFGEFAPTLDSTLHEIMMELQRDRAYGMIRPFVEGEAIGACPRRVSRPRITAAQHTKEKNKRRERQRAEMLELRTKNDAIIASILGRKF